MFCIPEFHACYLIKLSNFPLYFSFSLPLSLFYFCLVFSHFPCSYFLSLRFPRVCFFLSLSSSSLFCRLVFCPFVSSLFSFLHPYICPFIFSLFFFVVIFFFSFFRLVCCFHVSPSFSFSYSSFLLFNLSSLSFFFFILCSSFYFAAHSLVFSISVSCNSVIFSYFFIYFLFYCGFSSSYIIFCTSILRVYICTYGAVFPCNLSFYSF